MQLERRYYQSSISQTENRKLVGYAAVFNSLSDPFPEGFRERILPGAFARSLKNKKHDVAALINHDLHYVLGKRSAGTLTLEEDEHGLRVEVDPPDTSYARDLIVSMERKDVTQMSFGFWMDDRHKDQSWTVEEGVRIRDLRTLNLFDVSFVTIPQYPDTEAALRSMQEWESSQPAPIQIMRLRLQLEELA